MQPSGTHMRIQMNRSNNIISGKLAGHKEAPFGKANILLTFTLNIFAYIFTHRKHFLLEYMFMYWFAFEIIETIQICKL